MHLKWWKKIKEPGVPATARTVGPFNRAGDGARLLGNKQEPKTALEQRTRSDWQEKMPKSEERHGAVETLREKRDGRNKHPNNTKRILSTLTWSFSGGFVAWAIGELLQVNSQLEFLAYVSAGIQTGLAYANLIEKVVKEKTTVSFSKWAIAQRLTGGILWVAFGICVHNAASWVMTALAIPSNGVLIYKKLTNHDPPVPMNPKKEWSSGIATTLVALSLTALSAFRYKVVNLVSGLGLIGSILRNNGSWAQAIETVKHKSTVSFDPMYFLTSWLIGVPTCAIWFVYGLSIGQPIVSISNLVSFIPDTVVNVFILTNLIKSKKEKRAGEQKT